MEEAVPPALVLGCNTPHGIGVLSDWIEEQTGHAPDFAQPGTSDGAGTGDGSPNGTGAGYGYGSMIDRIADASGGYGAGMGYGWTCGDGYGGGMVHATGFINHMREIGFDAKQIDEHVSLLNRQHEQKELNRFSLGVRRMCSLHLTKPASVIKPEGVKDEQPDHANRSTKPTGCDGATAIG